MTNEKKVARIVGGAMVLLGVVIVTVNVHWGSFLWGGGVLLFSLSFVPNFF